MFFLPDPRGAPVHILSCYHSFLKDWSVSCDERQTIPPIEASGQSPAEQFVNAFAKLAKLSAQ
ncbi:hypothetical protein IMZ48_34885 [Candidatus Bathyarchaeota archaeon]|nr:hypothetical protein [Candidatus Bathyarchaeota archaeon]